MSRPTGDRDRADLRCPICRRGVLAAIAYDDRPADPEAPGQAPVSVEVLTFSCGHEVRERRLDEAARDDPNVERRTTDETVSRLPMKGDRP